MSIARALKRTDGWAFSIFAAALSLPFFDAGTRDFLDNRRFGFPLIIVGLINFILARIGSVIAQLISPSSTNAWIWGAGLITAPLFITFGAIDIVLSMWLWGKALAAAKTDSVFFEFFVIWALMFVPYFFLCMVGTAIFFAFHWIAMTVRRLLMAA